MKTLFTHPPTYSLFYSRADPGDLESCDVQFRTDSWRVSGKCEVKGLSSSLGCYKCWWISTVCTQKTCMEMRTDKLEWGGRGRSVCRFIHKEI